MLLDGDGVREEKTERDSKAKAFESYSELEESAIRIH